MKTPEQKIRPHAQHYSAPQLKKNNNTIKLQCASLCAPFHNSNKKPHPYKTKAATKDFTSIKLLCNHD